MRTRTVVVAGVACALVGAGAQTAAALTVRETIDRGRSVSAARLDAAQDAARADDTVASELARTAHLLAGEGFEATPRRGGR